MEHHFWAERWQKGQLGFHLGEVNRHLLAHIAKLAPQGPTRVLVPLCGKSLDLAWLRECGNEVFGVEFVEEAALAFFNDRDLEPAASRIGPHPTLRAQGITIVLDDVLALDPIPLGRFPAVWDRAALVALEAHVRRPYLEKLRALVAENGRILLVSFDHDIGSGPPFSVTEADLRSLCDGLFSLERLGEVDLLPEEPRFRERGATRVFEQIWLLRPIGPPR